MNTLMIQEVNMSRKIIIAVAPVARREDGSIDQKSKSQIDFILSPDEIAQDIVKCSRLSASLVHMHVRGKHGELTDDLTVFEKTIDLIKKDCNIIIEGSTGGVSTLTPEQRCLALDAKGVEVGVLNMGSVNLGEKGYLNTLEDIRFWAKRLDERRIVPVLELFEPGMIDTALSMIDEGFLHQPLVFGLCTGFKGSQESTTANLQYMVSKLPKDSIWYYMQYKMRDLSMMAASIAMGASIVRVGFEDSPYYAPGKVGQTNAILVEKIANVIRALGFEIATVEEAREMIGVGKV
jgi:3-keto-5-aminohexanoate cleavage enzyme